MLCEKYAGLWKHQEKKCMQMRVSQFIASPTTIKLKSEHKYLEAEHDNLRPNLRCIIYLIRVCLGRREGLEKVAVDCMTLKSLKLAQYQT